MFCLNFKKKKNYNNDTKAKPIKQKKWDAKGNVMYKKRNSRSIVCYDSMYR